MPSTLDADEVGVVKAVATLVSALSCAGSVSIILAYMRYAHLRRFAFLLVAILSCCDILNQVADFISPDAGAVAEMAKGAQVTTECYAQAILDSFFELASVLWTTAIAATLYMSVFLRMSADSVQAKLPYFALFCFGVPALLTAAPWFDNAYGPAGGWCWIIEAKSYWIFIQFYIPLWLAVAYNATTYVRVVRLLRRTASMGLSGAAAPAASSVASPSMNATALTATSGSDATAATIRRIVRRLQWYPFVLIIVYLPATVNRIVEVSSGGQQYFALFLLQRAFSSSQGLLNAVAYGMSDGVREAIIADARALVLSVCGSAAANKLLGGAGMASRGASNGTPNTPSLTAIRHVGSNVAELRGDVGAQGTATILSSPASGASTLHHVHFAGSGGASAGRRETPLLSAAATTSITSSPHLAKVDGTSNNVAGTRLSTPQKSRAQQTPTQQRRPSQEDTIAAAHAGPALLGADVGHTSDDDGEVGFG